MPHYEAIGYQSSFRKAVPVRGEGCIRVTHPSAARQQALLLLLPPDLHVLGLPLAFILSQDQTLRCINSFYIRGVCVVETVFFPFMFLFSRPLKPVKRLVLPVQFFQCSSAFYSVNVGFRCPPSCFFRAAKLGRFLFPSKLFMFSFC